MHVGICWNREDVKFSLSFAVQISLFAERDKFFPDFTDSSKAKLKLPRGLIFGRPPSHSDILFFIEIVNALEAAKTLRLKIHTLHSILFTRTPAIAEWQSFTAWGFDSDSDIPTATASCGLLQGTHLAAQL
jgi:hypothetical protein